MKFRNPFKKSLYIVVVKNAGKESLKKLSIALSSKGLNVLVLGNDLEIRKVE